MRSGRPVYTGMNQTNVQSISDSRSAAANILPVDVAIDDVIAGAVEVVAANGHAARALLAQEGITIA